jgi:hypothetical protein
MNILKLTGIMISGGVLVTTFFQILRATFFSPLSAAFSV